MKLLTTKCPKNYNVLACGMDYTNTYNEDAYRFAYPSNSSQCVCQDLRNAYLCYALCTNAPLTNFEIGNRLICNLKSFLLNLSVTNNRLFLEAETETSGYS